MYKPSWYVHSTALIISMCVNLTRSGIESEDRRPRVGTLARFREGSFSDYWLVLEVLRLVLGGNFILLTTGSSELAFLQGLERGVSLMNGPSSSSSP